MLELFLFGIGFVLLFEGLVYFFFAKKINLIDLVKKGHFDESKALVFIHTGGTPALFVYSNSFREYL